MFTGSQTCVIYSDEQETGLEPVLPVTGGVGVPGQLPASEEEESRYEALAGLCPVWDSLMYLDAV